MYTIRVDVYRDRDGHFKEVFGDGVEAVWQGETVFSAISINSNREDARKMAENSARNWVNRGRAKKRPAEVGCSC